MDTEAMTSTKIAVTARFVPQAWINDYAVEVDIEPGQQTEWDASDAFTSFPDHLRAEMLPEMNAGEEALDIDDILKSDPAAPEWVREYSGPFSIWVRLTDLPTAVDQTE